MRIVGADAANLAGLQAQLDRVEPGYVVEPEPGPHPDAEAVPPLVAHDCDAVDLGERNSIAPNPGPEQPVKLALAHLDGER